MGVFASALRSNVLFTKNGCMLEHPELQVLVLEADVLATMLLFVQDKHDRSLYDSDKHNAQTCKAKLV